MASGTWGYLLYLIQNTDHKVLVRTASEILYGTVLDGQVDLIVTFDMQYVLGTSTHNKLFKLCRRIVNFSGTDIPGVYRTTTPHNYTSPNTRIEANITKADLKQRLLDTYHLDESTVENGPTMVHVSYAYQNELRHPQTGIHKLKLISDFLSEKKYTPISFS